MPFVGARLSVEGNTPDVKSRGFIRSCTQHCRHSYLACFCKQVPGTYYINGTQTTPFLLPLAWVGALLCVLCLHPRADMCTTKLSHFHSHGASRAGRSPHTSYRIIHARYTHLCRDPCNTKRSRPFTCVLPTGQLCSRIRRCVLVCCTRTNV